MDGFNKAADKYFTILKGQIAILVEQTLDDKVYMFMEGNSLNSNIYTGILCQVHRELKGKDLPEFAGGLWVIQRIPPASICFVL